MANVTRFGFLALAAVFHLVYLFSIFDIYFVSPIVSGMRLISPERRDNVKAPADRLVLFVGDGLRADKAFQSFPEPYPQSEKDKTPRPLAPFLRSRVLKEGTFGVSHTRVPTESRPGHVALIAGLYEDVSAVATGWKLNPVNFDSLFNRSRHTWSWGSPDILPMFERGAVPGRVDTYTYGAEFEDFSSDATQLDYWVFDHVKDFFVEAATNESLNKALRQDKIVFFLHLLGIDTSGHGFRPYSKEYLNNIKVVDKGVQEVTELIQKFYGDDRTAFVFTADHGMSDYGSHGDGHPDNTRTPLITWGSGISPPRLTPGSMAPGHDELSSDWGLDQVQRHDVDQADVAALMAYLIGTEFPANSVGRLPLSYVSADSREKAVASLVNAQEILEMYRVKEEKKSATQLRYKPFSELSEAKFTPAQRVSAIRELIDAGKYEEAVEETHTLIGLALDGLRYLQTYDWLFLRALITLGYLGWMAYATTTVIDMYVVGESAAPTRSGFGTAVFVSALVALYASFIVSKSPLAYYGYAFFPIFFWEEVYARRQSLKEGRKILFSHVASAGSMFTLTIHTVIYVAIIQSLALGYIHREVFTCLFVVGAFWPASYGFSFLQSHFWLSLTWACACLVMSTFTLLPAMKFEDVNLITLGGGIMAAIGVLYLSFESFILSDFTVTPKRVDEKRSSSMGRVVTGVQIGLILLSIVVTRSSALSLQAGQGLPPGNQIMGWVVLVSSMLMPLAYRVEPNSHYMHRLMVMFLTCAPPFVILTISYEGLFYIAFCVTLLAWVRLEYSVQAWTSQRVVDNTASPSSPNGTGKTPYRPLKLSDARVALFSLVLLQSGFFSTGNVASVSTFSLESVQRLIPVFDPFSQGALLILKIMIPFALLSANLGVLNVRLGVPPSSLFMVVMTISDILTLYFFWVVRDEGSWLEIGSTISHFAITSLMCVFVALLEAISALFIAGVAVEQREEVSRKAMNGSKGTAKAGTNGHTTPSSSARKQRR